MLLRFFYVTGNFSKISYQIKNSPRDAQLAAGEFALRHRSRAKCVRAHTFLCDRKFLLNSLSHKNLSKESYCGGYENDAYVPATGGESIVYNFLYTKMTVTPDKPQHNEAENRISIFCICLSGMTAVLLK